MRMTAAAPVCACHRAFLSAFDTCLLVGVTCLRVSVTCLPVSVSPSLTRWMQAKLRTVPSNKMALAFPPRPTYPCRPVLFLHQLFCSCTLHARSFAPACARLVLLGHALVGDGRTSRGHKCRGGCSRQRGAGRGGFS
jgi:hypothetical protein